MSKRLLWTAILAVAIVAGIGVATLPRWLTIRQGKHLVAYNLLDPSSAQFREVKGHGSNVCGQVNGKNRNGAYVGFARFIADTKTKDAFIENNDAPTREDVDRAVNDYQEAVDHMVDTGFSGSADYEHDRATEALEGFKQRIFFNAEWETHCIEKPKQPTAKKSIKAAS